MQLIPYLEFEKKKIYNCPRCTSILNFDGNGEYFYYFCQSCDLDVINISFIDNKIHIYRVMIKCKFEKKFSFLQGYSRNDVLGGIEIKSLSMDRIFYKFPYIELDLDDILNSANQIIEKLIKLKDFQ